MSEKREGPPDRDQRDLIVSELGRNLLVEAAAGTGKTTSMIDRMAALLRSGECGSITTLAAVTFTRKAAAELRGKFRVRLEHAVSESSGAEKERLEKALSDIDKCYIGTIHSFCSRLLRERPVEAGVDLAFTELEEEDDYRLRKEAWREYISRLRTNDPEGLLESLEHLGLDLQELMGFFINNFCNYPDVQEWPAEEGPGLTGFAQTVREIESYIDDMREKAKKLPDDCGNDKLIPKYKSIPRIASHYTDLYEPAQCVEVLSRFTGKLGVTQKVWAGTGHFTTQDAKDEHQNWLDFQEQAVKPALQRFYEARYPLVLKVFEEARDIYDRLRRESGSLNYQDLLMKAASLLKDKPHIREYFRERYTHLLVDEFQDTDPIQAEVMMLLTADDPGQTDWRKCNPRPGSLFVVGDPKQSIYRFRRADIITYNEVKEIIQKGEKDSAGRVVSLSANFRTREDIIEWVNRVFEPGGSSQESEEEKPEEGMGRFPGEESDESPAWVALQPGRIESTEGELSGIYQLTIPEECTNKETIIDYEADRIARTIAEAVHDQKRLPRSRKDLEEGVSPYAGYGDFMIVTPTKQNLSAYARKLQEYGVPHQVTGGAALNEVRELRLLYKVLMAVVRPDDPVALVSVLRSELFGISDASLYDFKRAGGRFNYRSQVPEGLTPADTQSFEDAFMRLRRYSSWLSLLPPVSAFEKTVGDLGLMVLASCRPGGDVEAGSMAKAVELVRRFQGRTWSGSQLVSYLGELVDQAERYDGISVRPSTDAVVKVMNLHKVKGLEAPVVFLAEPYGKVKISPELYVDRSAERITGYMHLYKRNQYGQKGDTIARPPGWEELENKERSFQEAEQLRFLYVAATRAGAALVITRYEEKNRKKDKYSRWSFFEPYLAEVPELPESGEVAPAVRPEELLDTNTVKQAHQEIADRMERVARPTYVSRAAKQLAISERSEQEPHIYEQAPGTEEPQMSGEHGVEWGSAVHALLQVAMDVPDADLEARAKSVLAEQGLSPDLSETAASVVREVMSSELWQRAMQSKRHLTEVPFETRLESEDGPPVLARGVVDLAFQEEDGWVLVDYKTDAAAQAKNLADHYAPQIEIYSRAWKSLTGEPVKEASLYFIRSGEVHRVL
ncbi:MAG: UvrD-helicase domain-containing protein [bacterium]